MLTLMQAIAKMEGYGLKPDNIPTSHKNPGDIRAGQWANAHGAIPGAKDPRFPDHLLPSPYAVFNTPADGFAALRCLLAEHYCGFTLQQAIERYAPATENDTENYVRLVSAWTGIAPGTVLCAELVG